MKALILDGDDLEETRDVAVVEAAHRAGKRFWVELDERTPDAEHLLGDVLRVHPLAAEDLWNDIGLPKVEDFDEYVQLVIHGVRVSDLASDQVPLSLAELDLIIGKNFLVTHAHDEEVCGVANVFVEAGKAARLLKKGPAYVAHAVLDGLVDQYLPIIDRFDAQIDLVEEQILDETNDRDARAVVTHIIRIKRSLQMLRRTTIYQREILLRLARAEFDEIPHELVPFYRDVYDHFARVTELVDSYRELVASLLEAHFSMQSNRMNEVMKRLTVMSTIMLPLSVIAGVYGMNFQHMPELTWPFGYAFALSLMALVAVGIVLYFRAKRWL